MSFAEDEMLHYYAFSFMDAGRSHLVQHTFASTYIGYRIKDQITLEHLQQAKKEAGVSQTAVVLSISYMGCMSPKQMRGEE